ncbi:MAG: ATP-binding protein [Alloprevotella sp.]
MISRKIDKTISNHFKNSKSAILLTGARQTGKTYAVRKYADNHGLNLIEINFLEDTTAKMIFNGAKDAKDVLLRISAHTRQKTSDANTLIFFDEVQQCPEVITWIKFLVDEGSCKYALSGSLLGVELKDIRSVPVGYMTIKEVYPLDLMEFSMALGLSEKVLDSLRECWEKQEPVDAVIHESMLRLVRLYLVVGGMPAAVQAYIDSNDLNVVEEKQQEILTLYRWDISQYDLDNKLKIREMFDLIPSELDAKNKRFILKKLNEHARFSKYEDSVLWLKDAGVALPTYNVKEPTLPLKLNEQRNLFKLFQNDIGLLASQYASGIQMKILNNEIAVNYGAIYENLVAQELAAHGFGGNEHCIYYYTNKRQGELDFIIEQDGVAIPIEVKSGKDYERHNALSNVMNNPDYAIAKAYVLCNGNLTTHGAIIYAPIYMTMFIEKKHLEKTQIFRIDMTALKQK